MQFNVFAFYGDLQSLQIVFRYFHFSPFAWAVSQLEIDTRNKIAKNISYVKCTRNWKNNFQSNIFVQVVNKLLRIVVCKDACTLKQPFFFSFDQNVVRGIVMINTMCMCYSSFLHSCIASPQGQTENRTIECHVSFRKRCL